jgi:hypothetical protein
MEYIKRTVASFKGSPVSNVAPLEASGMDPQRIVQIPQSGLERAEWFAKSEPNLGTQSLGLCSGGMLAIGKNERGVQGAERDESFASLTLSRHNYANFPDPATLTSDDAAKIWNAQVAATRGLYDGDKEVYVSEDTQTIWT